MATVKRRVSLVSSLLQSVLTLCLVGLFVATRYQSLLDLGDFPFLDFGFFEDEQTRLLMGVEVGPNYCLTGSRC